MIKSGLLSTKIFFIRGYTKNWSREIFFIDSVVKSSSCTYKIKDLNKEKITGSFYEKELLLSNLWKSYYPEPDSHVWDKVKEVLDLTNYVIKKELEHAASVKTFDLITKNFLLLCKLYLIN